MAAETSDTLILADEAFRIQGPSSRSIGGWAQALPEAVRQECLATEFVARHGSSEVEKVMLFSHVIVGSNDLERSRRFYDALLSTLGLDPALSAGDRFIYYPTPTGTFSVAKPVNGAPATVANGGTIGFEAASPEVVDVWHATGLAAGGAACEDPPGPRAGGGNLGQIYVAYLRDPDGNKLCARHILATAHETSTGVR